MKPPRKTRSARIQGSGNSQVRNRVEFLDPYARVERVIRKTDLNNEPPRKTRSTRRQGSGNSQPEPLFSNGEYEILNREHRRKRFSPAELALIVEIKKIFHATITGVVEKPKPERKASL